MNNNDQRSLIELEALAFSGFFALYDPTITDEEERIEQAATVARINRLPIPMYQYDYPKGLVQRYGITYKERGTVEEVNLKTLLDHYHIDLSQWSWIKTLHLPGEDDYKNISPDVTDETLAFMHYCDMLKEGDALEDRIKEVKILHILSSRYSITLETNDEGTGLVWTDSAGAELMSSR